MIIIHVDAPVMNRLMHEGCRRSKCILFKDVERMFKNEFIVVLSIVEIGEDAGEETIWVRTKEGEGGILALELGVG